MAADAADATAATLRSARKTYFIASSLLLRDGVREVIPVRVDAVAVDPARDDAEAVELRAALLVALLEVERLALPVEGHGDLPLALGTSRVVLQRPVVRLAVGQDVRVLAVRRHAGILTLEPIEGIEEEPFGTRPFEVDAEHALRHA